jgi:hypothetical protein
MNKICYFAPETIRFKHVKWFKGYVIEFNNHILSGNINGGILGVSGKLSQQSKPSVLISTPFGLVINFEIKNSYYYTTNFCYNPDLVVVPDPNLYYNFEKRPYWIYDEYGSDELNFHKISQNKALVIECKPTT